MNMKNLILHVDMVLDILSGITPEASSASRAKEEAVRHGYRVWVVAATLPAMIRALDQEIGENRQDRCQGEAGSTVPTSRVLLKDFLEDVGILSSYAFEAKEILEGTDPERDFVLQAAETLGNETLILSRDQALIQQDARVLSPDAFLKLLSLPPEGEGFPFIDLKAQQALLLPELEERVRNVLRHGQYILGPEIRELEGRLAEYTGSKHAITCSSGTDALLMALMAYGVGPGDAVFTSPFTFIATAEAITLLGAVPVFLDIDVRTFNMDPEILKKAVQAVNERDSGIHVLPGGPNRSGQSLRPKGIIAVDLFGLPADYRAINAVAEEHGLFVIEDAAQSFGAEYHGSKACSLAPAGCTSFFPAKPLGCYGDGGAVFTDDDGLAEKMISVRVHGKGTDKYDNVRVGLNARMDTLQAAVLLPKLEAFPGEVEERNRAARHYTRLLGPNKYLVTPHVPDGLKSAWAQYSVLADRRDQVQAALKEAGIPSVIYYPKPLHLQTAYAGLGYKEGDFPVTEDISGRIFSLPMHPYLGDAQIERIAGVITGVLGQPGGKK